MPSWLTPFRATLGAAVLIALILLIIFYAPLTAFLKRQVLNAQAAEETAVDGRVGAESALDGQNDVNAAADRLRDTAQQARGSAHVFEAETLRAPGAAEPMDPVAADRLQRHDQFLCDLRPAVCSDRADSAAPAADPADRIP